MVKIKTKAKVIIIAVFITVLSAALTICVSASDQRVFDNAGLLSSDEVTNLEEYISELRTETGYDFVFLTDTDVPYNSDYDTANAAGIAHADDFYDYGGFGSESNNKSGIIFYLDMSNRNPIIITTGKVIDIINDARLGSLFDTAYNYLGDEDWAGAATAVFAQTKQYIDAGVVNGQYEYDAGEGGVDYNNYYGDHQKREFTLLDGVIALGGGLFMALVIYGTVKSKYELKGKTYKYDIGINTKCELAMSADDYLRETVTRTPRATANNGSGGRGSGTHTGSSGTSHGGGGGGGRF